MPHCDTTLRPLPTPEGSMKCPACDGDGYTGDFVRCVRCDFTGKVRVPVPPTPEGIGCYSCDPTLPPKGLPTSNILVAKVNANLLEIAMEAREWLISQGQNDEATRARIARVEKAISDAKEMV